MSINLALIGVMLLVGIWVLFKIRGDAKGAQRADDQQKTLDQLANSVKPATDAELNSVRDQFRRD